MRATTVTLWKKTNKETNNTNYRIIEETKRNETAGMKKNNEEMLVIIMG